MEPTSTTSSGTTVVIGIIIFILIIGLVLILYYIFTRPVQVPFPTSPFKYGDVVEIIPAVLSQTGLNTLNVSPDQYLSQTTCPTGTCNNCYQAQDPFVGNSCALTFTGKSGDNSSKWILRQFGPDNSEDANDGLVSGFGNRFYLQNASIDGINDLSGRVTFNQFNGGIECWQGTDLTFPIIGNTTSSCYGSSLIIYFLPTNEPDIYYILFPGSSDFTRVPPTNLNQSPNDGVVILRPWAQPSTSGFYLPWDSNNNLNANGMLLGNNPGSTPGPYPNPEVFLFKVTKTSI